MKSFNSVRIAIIGAGLSGLTAAYRLKQANTQGDLPSLDIKIFDATDRVGGRVRTLRCPNGLFAEAGGLMFTDRDTSMLSLVHEMGLSLVTRDDAFYPRFFVNNELTMENPSIAVADVIFSEIHSLLNTLIKQPLDWCYKQDPYLEALDNMSIFDYCVSKGFQPAQVQQSLTTMLYALLADDFHHTSALSAFRVLSQYANIKKLYSIKEGNDRLPQAIANAINDKHECIFLSTPVLRVCRVESQWEVSFKRGEQLLTELYDYVLMATPISMLQSFYDEAIELPDLSNSQKQAMNSVSYNVSIARVYCEVDKRFWAPLPTGAVITDKTTYWIEDHTAKQAGESGMLEAHFAGEKGHKIQTALDPAKAGEEAIAEVYGETFLSHLQRESTKVVLWSKREYQRGAYPYFRVGQRRLPADIAKPLEDGLYFIGEYTSLESPLSMEGAVASGNQVVEEVLLPTLRAKNTKESKFQRSEESYYTEPTN